MTTTFTAQVAAPQAAPLDPTKHVSYTLGMVLGVDDFDQEFAYLAERDRWLARDLVGYGTLSGLRVSVEAGATGPQVVVAAGAAVNPRGQLIRVPLAQCASLNDWLAAHRADMPAHVLLDGSPPGPTLHLHVVLSYSECPTDQVPVPGEPCRTEDQATVASRVADDFALELRFVAPDQFEEDALRQFVAWLGQVPITETAGPLVPADVEAAILTAAHLPGAPPCSPAEFMLGSPPSSVRVRPSDAAELVRLAFRVWSTQLRPRWRVSGLLQDWACADARPEHAADADGVLLASLTIPLVRPGATAATDDWRVTSDLSALQTDERRRPYVVHLRMLQEWLLSGRPPGLSSAGSGTGLLLGSPPSTALPQVVAAGVVRADASRRPGVYNGLYADTVADGQVILRFNGVRATDPAVRYVVTALPVYGPVGGQAIGPRSPVVTFDSVDAGRGGLVLYVTDGSAPIPQAKLAQAELMVQISQYGSGVGSP